MTHRDIRVHYEPEHDPATFDEQGTPILQYGGHPKYGMGWTLFYLEDDSETAGVDDHFIPGDLTDVDQVVETARSWLRRGRA